MADGNSFVMMGLGDYRFGINTAAYQQLDRTTTWRWPMVERIGARPAAQFVGPGQDSISLSGVVFPHFRGGLGQLEAMRKEADKGEPQMLVDGTGKVWGRYVITEVREGQEVFFSNGAPRCQHFDLSLEAYGDDGPTAAGSPIEAALDSLPVGGPAAFADALGSLDLGSLEATAAGLASKSSLAFPSLRSLVGMTTDGLGALTSAITTGAAILGDVQNLAASASAIANAAGAMLSAGSLQAFAEAGADLNAWIGQAQAAGDVPLNAIVDGLAAMPSSTVSSLLSRTLATPGAKVVGGLVEVARNG